MGLAHGSKITTNGLVFACDMQNVKKSWKGKPITNNSSLTHHTNWNNTGTATWNFDDTSLNRLFPTAPVKSMHKDTDGNSHLGIGNGAITAAEYTASCYVYIPSSAGTLAGSVPYFRSFPANTSRGSLTPDSGETDWNNWPRDEWIRIKKSWNNTAGDTSMYISCYLDTTGNMIYMTAPQLELNTFASPFVDGTRSSTASLKDLVNNTTLTATSVSYNSDNTFTFNGANYFSSNSPVNLPTTGYSTVLVWCKPSSSAAVSTYTGLVAWGGRGTADPSNSRLLSLNTNGTTIYVSSAFWGNDYVPNNLSVTANQWNLIGMISRPITTGNNVTLYCGNANGLNSTTGSSSVSSRTLNTSLTNLSIGCTDYPGRYFTGDIATVQIYNRELSAAEIKNIFIASRGRFGL